MLVGCAPSLPHSAGHWELQLQRQQLLFEATAAQTVIAQKRSDLVDEAKGGRRIEEGVLRPSFRSVGNCSNVSVG